MSLLKSKALWGIAGVSLFFGASGVAQAAGTAAGTDVNARATVTFTSGPDNFTVQSTKDGNSSDTGSDTTFKVDHKVDLLVVNTDSAEVSASNQGTSLLTFTVSNPGNGDLEVQLTPENASGDAFDPASFDLFIESELVPDGRDNSDTPYVSGTSITITTDETITVYVEATMPAADQVNGAQAVVYLLAEAVDAANSTTRLTESATETDTVVDYVLADAAGPSTADDQYDAAHSAEGTFQISASSITVSKVATVISDPINLTVNPKRIPGATIQWVITIGNAANASPATDVAMTDQIGNNMIFTAGSENLTGSNDGGPADLTTDNGSGGVMSGTESGGVYTISGIGDIAGGETVTITYEVTVE